MKRSITALAIAVPLLFATAAPAAADQPVRFGPFVNTFEDVNPCTGDVNTVTVSRTAYVHEHGDRTVVRGVRTTSTSDGFVGEGTSSFVANSNIELSRFTDVLKNPSGDRILVQGVFVFNLRSGSVRLDRFRLTCLGD